MIDFYNPNPHSQWILFDIFNDIWNSVCKKSSTLYPPFKVIT